MQLSGFIEVAFRGGLFMQFIRVKDYDEMSQLAYELVQQQLKTKKDSVIGFTTGYSPGGLVERVVEGINDGLDVSEATFLNLDEYVCPRDMDIAVHSWMNTNLYKKITAKPKNVFLLDGSVTDIDSEIKRYKKILDEYPRDIQILGLGVNGHIGANEPGDAFDKEIFLSTNQEASVLRHMEAYDLSREDVPKQMITLGMKDIMSTKVPILLVSGKDKAEAMKNLIMGEVDTKYPSTILRTHPNFICIYDEDAASLIK